MPPLPFPLIPYLSDEPSIVNDNVFDIAPTDDGSYDVSEPIAVISAAISSSEVKVYVLVVFSSPYSLRADTTRLWTVLANNNEPSSAKYLATYVPVTP